MQTRNLIIIVFLLTAFYNSARCQQTISRPSFSVVLDSATGPKLLQQCSRSTPKNIKSYWIPSQSDIDSLERRYNKIMELRAKECCIIGAKIDSLRQFGFQYIGVVLKGKKYIYINAFPLSQLNFYKSHNLDPVSNPVLVCDGGEGYWGALFDMNTKEFSSLAFNGFA